MHQSLILYESDFFLKFLEVCLGHAKVSIDQIWYGGYGGLQSLYSPF